MINNYFTWFVCRTVAPYQTLAGIQPGCSLVSGQGAFQLSSRQCPITAWSEWSPCKQITYFSIIWYNTNRVDVEINVYLRERHHLSKTLGHMYVVGNQIINMVVSTDHLIDSRNERRIYFDSSCWSSRLQCRLIFSTTHCHIYSLKLKKRRKKNGNNMHNHAYLGKRVLSFLLHNEMLQKLLHAFVLLLFVVYFLNFILFISETTLVQLPNRLWRGAL